MTEEQLKGKIVVGELHNVEKPVLNENLAELKRHMKKGNPGAQD